jgi:hypothetical protein
MTDSSTNQMIPMPHNSLSSIQALGLIVRGYGFPGSPFLRLSPQYGQHFGFYFSSVFSLALPYWASMHLRYTCLFDSHLHSYRRPFKLTNEQMDAQAGKMQYNCINGTPMICLLPSAVPAYMTRPPAPKNSLSFMLFGTALQEFGMMKHCHLPGQ